MSSLFEHLLHLQIPWLGICHLALAHSAECIELCSLYHPLILWLLEDCKRALDKVDVEELLYLHDVCAYLF